MVKKSNVDKIRDSGNCLSILLLYPVSDGDLPDASSGEKTSGISVLFYKVDFFFIKTFIFKELIHWIPGVW